MPSTDQLIRLLAPVPPMLEAAFGYEGGADLVAFYWTPCGDELAYLDSQGNGCAGANWNAWLVFVRHPAIAPFLSPFELGSSEDEAKYWLLLDRKARVFYIGTVEQVTRCLSGNSPPPPEAPVVIDEIEFNALIEHQVGALRKAMADWDSNTSSEMLAREQPSVQELRHWLGSYWQRSNVHGHDC